MALGAKIMLETKLVDLHMDKDGRVVGVSASTSSGRVVSFQARKGVVLACGGFGANAEMVAQYAPQLAGLPTDNSPGSRGDALILAQKYDIALEGLPYVECVAGNPPGRKTHARLFLPADFILINPTHVFHYFKWCRRLLGIGQFINSWASIDISKKAQ